ncbi:BLUF domain-containing protein [Planctomicrobium sp. SH668]|uniref:BLUF domain-containing protein n=1 Tax=Planctomicrobium sp. SH668 TaxID=3448126 RepID=UPI003F5B0C70
MIQLVYTSIARAPLSGVELSRLLLKSRANNEISGVSGLLLLRSEGFLHLLDGEESDVEQTFTRIAADPLHCGIQIVRRAYVPAATFPEWSLGFSDLNKCRMEMPAELLNFFSKKGRPSRQAGEIALQFMKEFRYGQLRRQVDVGYSPVIAR